MVRPPIGFSQPKPFFSVSPPPQKYEVADVLRLFPDKYRRKYRTTSRIEEVIRDILRCRTPAAGGVVNQCDECGAVQFVFKSCGNGFCPKCGKFRKAEWVARQEILVLPAPYFHVTFTTDHAINVLLPGNRKVILDALFWAVSTTLKEFGEKYLGGQPGFTLVLHTWGQTMNFHVHIHCIIPGIALSKDGERIARSGQKYLFDAKKLSAGFRDRFCRKIRRMYRKGELKLVGAAAEVDVEQMVKEMMGKNWEVYIKAFESAEKVLEYLSRYVHQVAISNYRIVNIDRRKGKVSFKYKDNRDGGKEKEMTLDGVEFIRRFLWHILPKGFWRFRHYGLHHGSCRKKLSKVRELLGLVAEVPEAEKLTLREWLEELTGEDILHKCPVCGGQMSKRGEYEEFAWWQLLLIAWAYLSTQRREGAIAAVV
jgi:hypothetical protein